jgi:hypothetical protein
MRYNKGNKWTEPAGSVMNPGSQSQQPAERSRIGARHVHNLRPA